jgi:hypothetical protein
MVRLGWVRFDKIEVNLKIRRLGLKVEDKVRSWFWLG